MWWFSVDSFGSTKMKETALKISVNAWTFACKGIL